MWKSINIPKTRCESRDSLDIYVVRVAKTRLAAWVRTRRNQRAGRQPENYGATSPLRILSASASVIINVIGSTGDVRNP